MLNSLRTSETAAKIAAFDATERAILYLDAGLPLDRVLDALKISRATWYRRVADHDAERAANMVRVATEWADYVRRIKQAAADGRYGD
jgi:hypothetical protein